jgi:nicotinate-nucleotide adenylyltransferase
VTLKIGLFFGSFNPVHIGHLIIANTIYEYTDMDEIWFIVSPLNPLKRSSKSLIHEFDRIDMVEQAIEDQPHFKAKDIEFHLPKPNYTVNTLAYLEEKHPNYDYQLIIGEDNLVNFVKWKNYEVILDHYGLIVYPRPNAGVSSFKDHPNVTYVKSPLIDISASFIRRSVKMGKSIKYLVPDRVYEYIRNKKLYT